MITGSVVTAGAARTLFGRDPRMSEQARQAQPAPDPWKSFRGVMAGTLILEAIVVLLALPGGLAADGGLTAATGTYLIGLAVVLVLLAGLQGRAVGDLGESRYSGGADRRVGRVTAPSASSAWCSRPSGC